MWKINLLIFASYFFLGFAAISTVLITLSFSRGQRSRFPILTKLDGKQLFLGLGAVLSFLLGYGLGAVREIVIVQQSFASQQGPGTAQTLTATSDAFELELLEAASERAKSARMHFMAGQELFLGREYRRAIPEFRASIMALPTLSCYLNLGISLRWTSDFPEAARVLASGLRLSRERGRRRFEPHFLFQLGTVDDFLGQRIKADSLLNEALRLYTEFDDEAGEANASFNLAGLYRFMGRRDAAKRFTDRARQIYRRTDNRLGLANVAQNEAVFKSFESNNEEALVLFRQSLAHYREIGNRAGEAAAQNGMGYCSFLLGKYTEAEKAFRECGHLGMISGNVNLWNKCNMNVAVVLLEEHRTDEALKIAGEALLAVRENHLPEDPGALLTMAQILVRKGDLTMALSKANEALVIAESTNNILIRTDVLTLKGNILIRMGRSQSALPLLKEAVESSKATGTDISLAPSLNVLGEALVALGRTTEGLRSMKQAEAIYARLGMRTEEVKELRGRIRTTEEQERNRHRGPTR